MSNAATRHPRRVVVARSEQRRFTGGAELTGDSIDAELGEVLDMSGPAHTSDTQITIYGATGLPFQDLVVAHSEHMPQLCKRQGDGFDLHLRITPVLGGMK